MTPIDPNAPISTVQPGEGTTPVAGTTSSGPAPGVSGDQGAQDGDEQGSVSEDGTPTLDDPSGGLTTQSYTDSANALGGLSIEEALLALAKASNEDKESSEKAQINKIEDSFQDSMDAVGEEKDAAKDRYTARMIKDATDIAGDVINAGTSIGAGASGMSDARVMGAGQAGSAAGGIFGDAGDMVSGGYDKDADTEAAQADADKALAQKMSSYAGTEGDHASFSGQLLETAVQLFQQKADDELATNRSLANFS